MVAALYVRASRLVSFVVVIAILAGCGDGSSPASWDRVRAQRLAALDSYLEDNAADFESFRTQPLAVKQGITNFVGHPMIVFRLLPEILPDIWGPPEDMLSVVGLGPDPYDPNAYMPLGTGFALSEAFDGEIGSRLRVNYATFSCMGCHSGKVVGSDGKLISMVGAPNPLGDFSGRVNQTVNDPRYTAANFKSALGSMPEGWVYGFDPQFADQERKERVLFNLPGGAEFFLEEVKFASNALQKRLDETLFEYTYDVSNPPMATGMPGSLDVFGFGAASLCNPSGTPPCDPEAIMPAAPAPADLPAAWMEAGRPRFQWDDSISDLTYREVFASLSVSGGDAAAVNMDNVLATAPFTEELPPHPYPFDVDMEAAARGATIYETACASCHASGNDIVADPGFVGTSPNRADVFTDPLVAGLITQARDACTAPECFGSDGQPLADNEILAPTGGYIQVPLVGVWATAPYLHNGSVPTLHHLLAGERPATFYRGNFTYDEERVGFTWDRPTVPSGLATLYDTSLDGYSNVGHSTPEFNGGIDWQAEPGKLRDLLEYLKTL